MTIWPWLQKIRIVIIVILSLSSLLLSVLLLSWLLLFLYYFIIINVITIIVTTVTSPLTDTLVRGQLYLRTLSQFPFLPPGQTLYLHIPVSGHSLVSGRGHFWKWNLHNLFSLFALSGKRTPHVLHKLTTLTEQQISGDRFSQAVRSFDMTSRKSYSCYFWLPNRT